jgi:hypothetical protein
MRTSIISLVACCIMIAATTAGAATADQKCRSGKSKAIGKYEACIQKGLTNFYKKGQIDSAAVFKCAAGLAAAWPKLQKLTDSADCGDIERFQDNGATFTDRLTGLTWMKQENFNFEVDYGNVADADNGYSINFNGRDHGGSAYTQLLEELNSGLGFDNSNGWRVPSLQEFMTLANQTVPGESGVRYRTRTDSQNSGADAWEVHLGLSFVQASDKTGVLSVRPVRGGF